jgi:[CysO sulfur-carrier protein]-S-L-cysteine hydrolase
MSSKLQIPRHIWEEIVSQARAERPNECCGLLAGKVEAGCARVTVRYSIRNALVSPTRYESDAREMFAAHKDMRHRQIDLLAIYHSHPTSEPIPSGTDLEQNSYGTTVVHLIVSLKGSEPILRAWRLESDRFHEVELVIETNKN